MNAINFNIPQFTSYEIYGNFIPPENAKYVFKTKSDDRSFLWLGNTAISGYSSHNSNIKNQHNYNWKATGHIRLNKNQSYPIRIQVGNGGGPGYIHFKIFKIVTKTRNVTKTKRVKVRDRYRVYRRWKGWVWRGAVYEDRNYTVQEKYEEEQEISPTFKHNLDNEQLKDPIYKRPVILTKQVPIDSTKDVTENVQDDMTLDSDNQFLSSRYSSLGDPAKGNYDNGTEFDKKLNANLKVIVDNPQNLTERHLFMKPNGEIVYAYKYNDEISESPIMQLSYPNIDKDEGNYLTLNNDGSLSIKSKNNYEKKKYNFLPNNIRDNLDKIQGVLYVKDLLPHLEKENFNWTSLLRKPLYIPENKKLDDLLTEFKTKKIHMAIVVDEYGGTSGIITLEDVIEEIFGELSDEFDEEDNLFSKLDENTYVFDSKINLQDFYRAINLKDTSSFDQVSSEIETLGGLLIEKIKKIPRVGQIIYHDNYKFIIEIVDNKRIKQVKLILPK